MFGNAGMKDIAYAYDGQDTVAFNLTRCTEGRVNYTAMEALKDGLLFSAKYESEPKVYPTPPAMVVMSNTLPDYSSMSLDRWRVLSLRGGALTELPSPPPSGDTFNADDAYDDDGTDLMASLIAEDELLFSAQPL